MCVGLQVCTYGVQECVWSVGMWGEVGGWYIHMAGAGM